MPCVKDICSSMFQCIILLAVVYAATASTSGACSSTLRPLGKCCVFPFEYNGRIYNSCTVADSPLRPWCATTSNFTHDGKREYCELQQGWCPLGWYHLKISCVFISPSPPFYSDNDELNDDKWNRARKACNQMGAELMVPRDRESLHGLLSVYKIDGGIFNRKPLFLGSRENMNTQLKWLNGGVVAPDLWGPGEPNTGRCGAIENFEKRWWEKECGWWLTTSVCHTSKKAYICESLPANNTCAPDYALIEGRCYKIHTWPRMLWDDAWWECESNNGYLAIIDTAEKLQQIVSFLQSESYEYRFHIGLFMDLSKWSWLDGTSVDASLFEVGYPKIATQDETCVAFHGSYPTIVNLKCDLRCGYACESFEGNVAYGSLTQSSSVATRSNSSFAVDNNLTTCYNSQKEVNPWLKIQLSKEFFIYKVNVETTNNTNIDNPLTVSIGSPDQSGITLVSSCEKKHDSGPYLEYRCIPPVKGSFVRVNGTSVNAILVLCDVTVLGLETEINAVGVLREGWYTNVGYDDIKTPDMLREWELFRSERKFWNVMPMMDTPSNFANFYAQKLTSYMKVNESGNHLFYMTCDRECELWIYDIGDLESPEGTGSNLNMERKRLIKLDDMFGRLEWNREPHKQTSKPTFLSRCRLYGIEVFMWETMNADHLSVGIKFPNGQEQKPMKAGNLFWLKTGERHLKFSNIRFEPNNTFIAEIGTAMSVSGSYSYCCQGIVCPDCNLKVSITILNNHYILNASLSMNCNENYFNVSLNADAPPGKYRIQAHYSFVDESFIKHREIGHVSVTAAVLNECRFAQGICQWKSSSLYGSSWKTGGAYKGAYLRGLSKASLESPRLPWKESYKRTFTCLQFKYILPDEKGSSTLQIYVGTQVTMALFWKLRGYHGNESYQAQLSWESRKDVTVAIKGEAVNNGTVAVVIQDLKIFTNYCSFSPVFATPGHLCNEEEFRCKNYQCVKKSHKCDGHLDCLDGSDEKLCKCLNHQFTCSSGACLSPEKLRDGNKDCSNGEDEKETHETINDDFLCFDGKPLPWSQTCKKTTGCADDTHIPSICGEKNCPLNDLTCSKQRGSSKKENESTCRIPFKGPCDFQNGLCGLNHDVNVAFHWTTRTGPTPSKHTGPSFDHTALSKEGHYLYVEASNRQAGDRARLQSDWFIVKRQLCLQFWYHMYGSEIGSLNIYIKISGAETKVWSHDGNIGDQWMYGQVPIRERRTFRFIIEGVTKGGSSGDIAIDDVNILDGNCSEIVKQESSDCFFDEGPCGWTGEQDWAITSSKERGLFLSFQTPDAFIISKTLTTKDLQPTDIFQCLRFWHFIGEEKRSHSDHGLTKLDVLALLSENSSVAVLWSTSYRTDRWVYTQFPLNKSQSYSKVFFKGTLQSATPISLAVDDISFSKEHCETIPNSGRKDTCTWLTQYHTCCKFPFYYYNTEYYSCTTEENDRHWCYFDDGSTDYGTCQDICLWMTESGKCCAFPFEYKNKTYSSCITTPDRPRPWCLIPIQVAYLSATFEWDYCKGYCGLGRELCQWEIVDSDKTWQSVSRDERKAWKEKYTPVISAKDRSYKEVTDQDGFEILLPLAMLGNITIDNAIYSDLEAFTICVWVQRNGSAIEIKYSIKSSCGEVTAFGILVTTDVTITIQGNKWNVLSFVVDEEWHHVCVSWLMLGGILKTFVDGQKRISLMDSLIDGGVIKGGGILTVSCPNVTHSSANATGRIIELNIWKTVLDEEEMQRMSIGCGSGDGDLMSWRSMLSGLLGDALVNYGISSCRDSTGYRLAILSFSSSNKSTPARVKSPWYDRSTEGYGKCLKFRYMLLGSGNSTINLYQRDHISSRKRPIWQDQSTGDSSWRYGQVSVSAVTEHQLIFEGDIKQEASFLAIGGLYFTNGYCSTEPSRATKGCLEHLTSKSGLIMSPYYPGYYANDRWCEWLITAPSGNVIRLEFLYFQLENESRCLNDFVEVFDGSSTSSASLGKFCGHSYPAVLASSSTDLLVVFKSNQNIVRPGFKAYYYTRKEREEQCRVKQDCPVGCKCYIIKGTPQQYVLQGAGYVQSIPKNMSSLTTVLLFGGSKITRILDGDFKPLSSLIYIDLSHNKIFQIKTSAFQALFSLETLRMNGNFLKELNKDVLGGLSRLHSLDLSENLLAEIPEGVLDNLTNLEILSLRFNRIQYMDKNVFKYTNKLTHLYLDHNLIMSIEEKAFTSLSSLKYLHLNSNRLKKLTNTVFSGLVSLTTLLLDNNNIVENEIATDTFDELVSLKKLSVDSFILCCYAKKTTEGLTCDSPKNEFSSCEDMMKNPAVRVCLWILGLLALVGNLAVIIWRLVYSEDSKIQSFLFTNLAVSDFLMGVYLIIIAVQDTRWQGEYFNHDVVWRMGVLCQVTGALSMLSSEVSVMLLTLITADRLICIVFTLRVQRLSLKACYIICFAVWTLGLVLSFLPMSDLSYFYDADKGIRFYGRSAVCLALQLSNDRPPGWEYSVSIFIGLNLLAFLFISFAYSAIFFSAVKSSSSIRSTNAKRESALAKRVAFIILTDFCCWMPVIIVGILSVTGSFHDPEKQAYVWIAVFVLPVNSSVNPILYTLATPQVRKWLTKVQSRKNGPETRQGHRQGKENPAFKNDNPAPNKTTSETGFSSSSNPITMEQIGDKRQRDSLQPTTTTAVVSVDNCSIKEENTDANIEYDTRF